MDAAFGAQNFSRVGRLLQTQLAIHFLLLLFVVVMWVNAESILIACGQPSKIAALSHVFIQWRLPALIPMVVVEDLKNYLNAQQIMRGPTIISVISSVAAIAFFAPLIKHFGFLGAPLSLTIANIMQCVLMMMNAKKMVVKQEAWPKWSRDAAMTGWSEMLQISLPSGMMILCEWFGWEINLFFAGLLCSNKEQEGVRDEGNYTAAEVRDEDNNTADCIPLDVFPILSNVMVISFMILFGYSIAAGTLIGNSLGAGEERRKNHNTTQHNTSQDKTRQDKIVRLVL